jgi:DnaJ-class molecular chaperone
MRTHYEILEVARSASQAEIRRAFRKKLLYYHPDKRISYENNAFCEIQAAWNVLKNAELRRSYDESLCTKECCEEAIINEEIQVSEMESVLVDEYTEGFVYKCRCSGDFVLEKDDIELLQSGQKNNIVLSCNYCSSCLQVSL